MDDFGKIRTVFIVVYDAPHMNQIGTNECIFS